jgi:GH25 family lysozyme M1 (1,4-beta-N-acetylmuramidase)
MEYQRRAGQLFERKQLYDNGGADLIFGLDVSSCQQKSINWVQVRQSTVTDGSKSYGLTFAYIRASKGKADVDNCEFKDPNFDSWAQSAGMVVGAYHVAAVVDPSGGTFSPDDEASFFVNVAGSYIRSGNLRPAIDVEDQSCGNPRSIGWQALADWLDEWLKKVHTLTGVWPVIYCSGDYKTHLNDDKTHSGYYLWQNYDLWVAYVLNPPNPDVTPVSSPWASSVLYQYSWSGVLNGLQGQTSCANNPNSYADLDVFQGTQQQFQSVMVIPTSGGGGSPPVISTPQFSGGTFTLSVASQSGSNYVLEYKNSLDDASWTSIQTNAGNGGTIVLTNRDVNVPSRLYRVRVE